MKAIILAAGKGERLKRYTLNKPKGMLFFAGQTLIYRQVSLFKQAGLESVIIVTGHCSTEISYENVNYYHNPEFETTNMVESFFCAEREFNDALIVSYADICFERRVLDSMIAHPGDIVVAVDTKWEDYWNIRYGSTTVDTESLELFPDGTIKSLGKPNPNPAQIHGRYVGLIKFSAEGIRRCVAFYHQQKSRHWDTPWQVSGNIFQKAYMTDLLQALIDHGEKVVSCRIQSGWIEFDTEEDYEKMTRLMEESSLSNLIDLNA